MSIGIVSDAELNEEVERLTPSRPRPEVKRIQKESHGRNEGDVNVPDSLRAIIGEDAVINGRSSAIKLAREFGISSSSVSAYAKGATSTASYDSPSKSLISHINKSRRRAIGKAQKTLNSALSAISQEKLDYADPKDLASIAKDMTVVIKNLEPSKEATSAESGAQQQFVIFAPTFKEEKAFETIDVRASE
jgi:predicted transcriptional regulator